MTHRCPPNVSNSTYAVLKTVSILSGFVLVSVKPHATLWRGDGTKVKESSWL
jgi:hypothetical protein